MKMILLFVASLLVALPVMAQEEMTAEKWRDDLNFLQSTVHEDYSFLFRKITGEQFDAQAAELYQIIPELEDHEIVAGLARLVSSFQYGHTSLGLRGNPFVKYRLPVNLYQFSDGIYIEGAHRDYDEIVGARVLAIAGKPVDDALTMIRPVVPAENDQFFKAHGIHYLCIPELLHAQGIIDHLDQDVTLTLEKSGTTFDKTISAIVRRPFPTQYGITKTDSDWLSCRDDGDAPLYLSKLDKIYFFKFLPEQNTVYVRHSQIQDDPNEDIPSFYQRVFEFVEEHEVDRLVLDVRLNGGGNNYKNKPIVTGIIRTDRINQPGRLFVITGRRTFSACQNLVNELDNYTNAIFVGEPTSENINFYGDNRRVELPNSGIPVFLSFAWWQDKPQWEDGPWTAPQLAVETSFDDYRLNRDPVLQAALEFSDDDFIVDPMAHLTALFEAGKKDELVAEATRMVNDPKYRFFDFESQANKAGYDLLNDDRVDEALFVFQLNAGLFPDSANAWDSLAEAHWRADKTEKAIELYNRAIELDPAGPIGDNARAMLKQINDGG